MYLSVPITRNYRKKLNFFRFSSIKNLNMKINFLKAFKYFEKYFLKSNTHPKFSCKKFELSLYRSRKLNSVNQEGKEEEMCICIVIFYNLKFSED